MKLAQALALCSTDAERKTVKSIWQGHMMAAQKKDPTATKDSLDLDFTEESLKARLVAKPKLSFRSIMLNFNLTQKEALELLEAAAKEQYESQKEVRELEAKIRADQKKLKELKAQTKK